MDFPLLPSLAGLAAALAFISLGGGCYEFLVVDPFWPQRPELIQPDRGGISRRRFWIPAHVAFELCVLASLAAGWHQPGVRMWLLIGIATHVVMRVWSAFDFIPKSLAFERAAKVDEQSARAWARRSRLRFPLDLATCASMLAAFVTAVRLSG